MSVPLNIVTPRDIYIYIFIFIYIYIYIYILVVSKLYLNKFSHVDFFNIDLAYYFFKPDKQ